MRPRGDASARHCTRGPGAGARPLGVPARPAPEPSKEAACFEQAETAPCPPAAVLSFGESPPRPVGGPSEPGEERGHRTVRRAAGRSSRVRRQTSAPRLGREDVRPGAWVRASRVARGAGSGWRAGQTVRTATAPSVDAPQPQALSSGPLPGLRQRDFYFSIQYVVLIKLQPKLDVNQPEPLGFHF